MSQNAMTMKMMIEQAENDLLHTYNRYQVVLDHGEGVYLYDVEGKKYYVRHRRFRTRLQQRVL